MMEFCNMAKGWVFRKNRCLELNNLIVNQVQHQLKRTNQHIEDKQTPYKKSQTVNSEGDSADV